MRWRLLIAASTAAALVGAGGCLAAAHFLPGSARPVAPPGPAAAAAFLIPLAAVAFASVFVYRHTARRRTLQAVMTALLALLLTLSALVAGAAYLSKPPSEPVPPAAPAAKAFWVKSRPA